MARREDTFDKVMRRTAAADRGYETECWEWQGPSSGAPGRGRAKGRGHSYPRMNLDGQTVAVHRVTFTHENGYIPGKKQIDHLCKNRLCVRPTHLELTTHKQNQKRKVKP